DQCAQRRPCHNPLHLGQKPARRVGLAFRSDPTVASVSCFIPIPCTPIHPSTHHHWPLALQSFLSGDVLYSKAPRSTPGTAPTPLGEQFRSQCQFRNLKLIPTPEISDRSSSESQPPSQLRLEAGRRRECAK